MNMRFLFNVFVAHLLLGWIPTIGFAAGLLAQRGREPLVLDWVLVGFSIVLATMSGLSALAWHFNKRINGDPPQPIQNGWLFGTAHMLASWVAGALMFVIGRANEWEVYYSLSAIIPAAFLGAAFIERYGEKLMGMTPAMPQPKQPST